MLICQITDLHVRPIGMMASGIVDTNRLTERAFRAVAKLDPRPDAVIITGDLTECGLEEEYDVLIGLLRQYLRMPVYVIPGNHDERENFRRRLAALPGVSSSETFVQYTVENYPVRLVMLDTLVPGSPHGGLCDERLAFLDRALAMATDRPTIIAMHHPPFACGIDHMDRMNLRNSDAFTAVVAKYPHVERIICGHVHRPVIARVANAVATIGPSVAHQVGLELRPDATGAFVMEPPAFHLHRWTRETGVVTHTAYVDDYAGPFLFADIPAHPVAK